jgi:hypothetical protein
MDGPHLSEEAITLTRFQRVFKSPVADLVKRVRGVEDQKAWWPICRLDSTYPQVNQSGNACENKSGNRYEDVQYGDDMANSLDGTTT